MHKIFKMKNIFTSIFFILSLNIAFAQKKKINPPGTTHLNGNLYLDLNEISNLDYLEYIYFIKKHFPEDTTRINLSNPDSTIWGNDTIQFHQKYLKDANFRNYPVVGISYEQALDYCKFRTDAVNIYLMIKEGKVKFNDYEMKELIEMAPKRVRYRLPTEEEWMMAAALPFSPKTLKKIEKTGGISANFMKIDSEENNKNKTIISTDLTAPTDSYFTNENGYYNLFGNAAEMIMEKGIAKGGGFIHYQKDIDINTRIPYEKPSNWLGFRCVAEILLEN
jgi:formylglycine-generating enzyme required for sulfatase activity